MYPVVSEKRRVAFEIELDWEQRRVRMLRRQMFKLRKDLRHARALNINLFEENHRLHEAIRNWIKQAQNLNAIDYEAWINCVLDGIEMMSKF